MRKPKKEVAHFQNPHWEYVPSLSTNVMQRFKALGWTPPSENKPTNQQRK
jgi:hypothetical protein